MSGLLEDLGIGAEGERKAIDHDWSKAKKIGIGIGVSVLSIAAVIAGTMIWSSNKPIRLPRTAQEAATVMASERFQSLPRNRQDQYAYEAGRLMRSMSEDEVRAMFQDDPDRAREMVGQIFEARSREVTIARAYGAEIDFRSMFEGFRGMRGAMQGMREGLESMTPEEREQWREQRRAEAEQQQVEQLNSGNPQDQALRAGMMGGMMRGGFGGGRGRGGGGGGGGRGGGGRGGP